MPVFLDTVLKLALILFVIKFLWDALVRNPQEKLEKQVEFLIARYANSILYPNEDPEYEIERLEFQANHIKYNEVPVTEYSNYTDENKELLFRVYKKIQKYIEEDRNEANK